MPASELIGLDLGRVHTGIARASSTARLAEPLESVATKDLPQKLNNLILAEPTLAIVIGLPRNLNGDDTDQTRWVRQFTEQLKSRLQADFYWQDETLTTKKAEGLKTKLKGKTDDHAIAAAVILQDWIDTPESERVPC